MCFLLEWIEESADGSSVGATGVRFLRGSFVGATGTEVGETGAIVGVLVGAAVWAVGVTVGSAVRAKVGA